MTAVGDLFHEYIFHIFNFICLGVITLFAKQLQSNNLDILYENLNVSEHTEPN